MNTRWRSVSRLMHQGAVDVEMFTVRCPICGYTETMSKEQADKYEVNSVEICEDCFDEIARRNRNV